MKYYDIAEIFMGKYPKDAKPAKERKFVTEKDINEFRELLSISEAFTKILTETESSKEYFETFELLKKAVNKDLQEELFYTAKLGFFYESIPSKLVYYLRKVLKKYDTPNNAISALDLRVMDQYFKPSILPNGVTLKQVLENLLGCEIDLITKYRRFAQYKDVMEIYVENTDRILVLPKEFAIYFESQKDIESVTYVKDIGVCLQGIPIRTLGGRMGITFDEYDLRDCK